MTEQANIFDQIPNKAEWIAALRGGEYKQGKEALYNHESDSYCCLGVYAKVCGYTFAGPGYDGIVDPDGKTFHGYRPIRDKLPGEWPSHFAVLNDHFGWSFERIADLLDGKGPPLDEVIDMIGRRGEDIVFPEDAM